MRQVLIIVHQRCHRVHDNHRHQRVIINPTIVIYLMGKYQTFFNNCFDSSRYSSGTNTQQDLQVRKWKTSYGQYRVCYIGDLPNDFLQVKLLTKSEMNSQLKVNHFFPIRIIFSIEIEAYVWRLYQWITIS